MKSNGKKTKVAVNYKCPGTSARQCGNCDMYTARPSYGHTKPAVFRFGICSVVNGEISAHCVCNIWEPKK